MPVSTPSQLRDMLDGLVNLAHIIHNYYEALMEEGFSDEQAMSLATKLQESVLAIGTGNTNESE